VTRFRPCIDLHLGRVKQIVGASFADDLTNTFVESSNNKTIINHISDHSASDFASLYAKDNLTGGHMILLGLKSASESAAIKALQSFPGGLQIGGGITIENGKRWLDYGASKVIVTSWLFSQEGNFNNERLKSLSGFLGKESIVVDLSCKIEKSNPETWRVMKDHWQTPTNLIINKETLSGLSEYCSEFLVHSADFEGKCQGIDELLVQYLGEHCPIPITYAGGVNSMLDLELIDRLSKGRVDVTIGSALDLFGGGLIKYKDCISWNNRNQSKN